MESHWKRLECSYLGILGISQARSVMGRWNESWSGSCFLPPALTRLSSPGFCSKFGEVDGIFFPSPKGIVEERGAGKELFVFISTHSVPEGGRAKGKHFLHFSFEGDVGFQM